MPITNKFKCPNGHPFEAVAKIRARCPECGQTARRNFTSLATSTISSSNPGEKIILSSIPTSSKEEGQEDTEISSERPISSGPIERKSEKSTKPSVRVIKRGKMPTPKKKVITPVKRHIVHHSIPSITKRPVGSRQHKMATPPESGPYWTKVKKAYFG